MRRGREEATGEAERGREEEEEEEEGGRGRGEGGGGRRVRRVREGEGGSRRTGEESLVVEAIEEPAGVHARAHTHLRSAHAHTYISPAHPQLLSAQLVHKPLSSAHAMRGPRHARSRKRKGTDARSSGHVSSACLTTCLTKRSALSITPCQNTNPNAAASIKDRAVACVKTREREGGKSKKGSEKEKEEKKEAREEESTSRSANAISGSIIQNSARWREVWARFEHVVSTMAKHDTTPCATSGPDMASPDTK
eukprot:1090901-Rhodomonas_salina.4